MRKIYLMTTAMLAMTLMAGCNELENTKPENSDAPATDITGTTAVGYNGGVRVSWTNPEDGDFSYVKLDFTNPLTGKPETARILYPGSTWYIDGLSPTDGTINFLVTTVSPAGVLGVSQTVSAAAALPADVTALTATPGANDGKITLAWNNPSAEGLDPADEGFDKVEIAYIDPRDESSTKGEVITESVPYSAETLAVSHDITMLMAKYGEIDFTVTVVAKNGLRSAGAAVSATANRALRIETKLPLTVDMLSSNASDPSEGDLATLLDGNVSTYWHSNWHSVVPYPNHIQVTMPESVREFKFKTTNRNRTAYGVKAAEVLLGTSEANLTKAKDGDIVEGMVSNDGSAVFSSPIYQLPDGSAFNIFRYNVLSSYGGTGNTDATFWSLSEIEVYKVWDEPIP